MAIVDVSGGHEGKHARRSDLDWLRVIAFGLLIFYHVGMFYVTWDWHVKSIYAGPAAEPVMQIVNPWRLALLFFISGVAVRFASDKTASPWGFLRSRAYRLGLPIVMGMIVIVAPQSYFQLRQAGLIEPGYFAFWGNYLNLEQLYPMITPTWNHLWYVVYLLVYILLIAPALPLLRRFAEGAGGRALGLIAGGPARLIFFIAVPFIFYELVLSPRFPTTHDLFNDWAHHAHRFTMFMLGYFAAKNGVFWRSVDRALPAAAALALMLGAAGFYINANAAAIAASPVARIPHVGEFHDALHVLYAWSCIVVLFGIAQGYLNRPSAALSYLTGAVFCYYILHQTIIIIAGYYITQWRLGVGVEFCVLTALTIAGCALGYEILRRIPGLRPWFGIKTPAPAIKRSSFAAVA